MKKLFILLSIILFINCGKKLLNEEIMDCDPIGNYFHNGTHYISRELINEEEGTINYLKLLEKGHPKSSECNPINFDPSTLNSK